MSRVKGFDGSPDAIPDRVLRAVVDGAGSGAGSATATHRKLESAAQGWPRGRERALPATVRELRARDLPACLSALQRETPTKLYAIGDTELLAQAPEWLVAIVGTREATPYGLRVAKALARAFAEAGAVIVSGLARGIDSAAHEGALEAGGKTIAVLGTGVDVPYPAGNRTLHGRIAATGLVLSESEPGRAAFAGCFPRRNRIIAALSQATIVVEAGHKSGALNTASLATEIGRTVACVPGMIDIPRAAGSNHLLRDGAHFVASVDDALALLKLSRNDTARRPEMGANEAELWDCLGSGPAQVDALASRSGLGIRQVLEAVSRLEVAGLVTRSINGEIGRAVLEVGAV